MKAKPFVFEDQVIDYETFLELPGKIEEIAEKGDEENEAREQ